MKTLKYIFGLCLALLVVWNCSDDDNLDYLNEVDAPSEVTAIFRPVLDESTGNLGHITITPNAIGAVSYNVNFGDGDGTEDTTKVNQGESVIHQYAEHPELGSYTVTIEAVGITGLTTIGTELLPVVFEEPIMSCDILDPDIDIVNHLSVSKRIDVTATATYGISYSVYFGEPGNDEPETANNGDTVSYPYQEAGLYTIRVVAMSASVQTTECTIEFEVTEILQPITSAPTPQSRDANDVISIYSVIDSDIDGNIISSVYSDVIGTDHFPDWGQAAQGSGWATFDLDDADEMLQYINLSYQGIALADGTSVDVSGMEFLHMDVWTADEGERIETSIINNASGVVTEAPVWSDLTAGEWTSIEIPISDYTDQGLTVNEIFQMKFVGDPWAAGTVFIDNIYFWKTPSVYTPLIFDDFEGGGNITTWFGDAAGLNTALANPYVNADNFSATVLEYDDTGGQYANVQFVADSKFNLSGVNNVFTLKIYVPSSSVTGSQPNQISLKLQNSDLGGNSWQTQTEIIKPIVLDAWQEISFNFETDTFINLDGGSPDPVDRTDLDKVVIQVNSENNNDAVKAFIDDFNYGTAPPQETSPIVKDGFEGFGTITTWAGDNCGMDNAFANPFIDANNNSATVLEYDDAGGQYANIQFTVTPIFDLVAKSKFTLKIYVPSSGITGSQPNQISLKLQDSSLGGNAWQTQTEIIKPVVLDTWQEISFDFVNDPFINLDGGSPDPVDRTDLDKVVLQVNSENNNDFVIAYIDDFNYHN